MIQRVKVVDLYNNPAIFQKALPCMSPTSVCVRTDMKYISGTTFLCIYFIPELHSERFFSLLLTSHLLQSPAGSVSLQSMSCWFLLRDVCQSVGECRGATFSRACLSAEFRIRSRMRMGYKTLQSCRSVASYPLQITIYLYISHNLMFYLYIKRKYLDIYYFLQTCSISSGPNMFKTISKRGNKMAETPHLVEMCRRHPLYQ